MNPPNPRTTDEDGSSPPFQRTESARAIPEPFDIIPGVFLLQTPRSVFFLPT